MEASLIHLSRGIVVGVIILLALYDLAAYAKGGTKATISAVVWDLAKKHPEFCFGVGVVMGHLFWHSC